MSADNQLWRKLQFSYRRIKINKIELPRDKDRAIINYVFNEWLNKEFFQSIQLPYRNKRFLFHKA